MESREVSLEMNDASVAATSEASMTVQGLKQGTITMDTSTSSEIINESVRVGDEREMCIKIWRHQWARLKGSRAQLEAEGLIPEGFEWPERDRRVYWSANGLSFSLRRTRPDGLKGPMKLWVEGDWWFVDVELDGGSRGFESAAIMEKTEALQRAIYEASPEGKAESYNRYMAYCAANKDPAFQAFKALIPILAQPKVKRGRKPRQAESSTKSEG